MTPSRGRKRGRTLDDDTRAASADSNDDEGSWKTAQEEPSDATDSVPDHGSTEESVETDGLAGGGDQGGTISGATEDSDFVPDPGSTEEAADTDCVSSGDDQGGTISGATEDSGSAWNPGSTEEAEDTEDLSGGGDQDGTISGAIENNPEAQSHAPARKAFFTKVNVDEVIRCLRVVTAVEDDEFPANTGARAAKDGFVLVWTRRAASEGGRGAWAIFDDEDALKDNIETAEDDLYMASPLGVTKAPLHADGLGRNETGEESATLRNFKRHLLEHCVEQAPSSDACVKVVFLHINAMAALVTAAGDDRSLSTVHTEFDPDEMGMFGVVPTATLKEKSARRVRRVLAGVRAEVPRADFEFMAAIHSNKVYRCVKPEMEGQVVCYGPHPSAWNCHQVATFKRFCEFYHDISLRCSVKDMFGQNVLRDNERSRQELWGVADDVSTENTPTMPVLHKCQQDLFKRLCKGFEENRRGELVVACTGFGKSLIMRRMTAWALQRTKTGNVVICVPAHLVRDVTAAFKEMFDQEHSLAERVAVVSASCRFECTTFQSVHESTMNLADVALVVVDEVHALPKLASDWVSGLKGEVYKVLCTATPLNSYFGEIMRYTKLLGMDAAAKPIDVANFLQQCWSEVMGPAQQSSISFADLLEQLGVNCSQFLSVADIQERYIVNRRVIAKALSPLQEAMREVCLELDTAARGTSDAAEEEEEEDALPQNKTRYWRQLLELSPRTVINMKDFREALTTEQKTRIEPLVEEARGKELTVPPCVEVMRRRGLLDETEGQCAIFLPSASSAAVFDIREAVVAVRGNDHGVDFINHLVPPHERAETWLGS